VSEQQNLETKLTEVQTTPERDAALAEWHQQRFLEANKPKRTNADLLRDLMNDPNRKSVIHRDGTGRS
jgi:hypothetical protein